MSSYDFIEFKNDDDQTMVQCDTCYNDVDTLSSVTCDTPNCHYIMCFSCDQRLLHSTRPRCPNCRTAINVVESEPVYTTPVSHDVIDAFTYEARLEEARRQIMDASIHVDSEPEFIPDPDFVYSGNEMVEFDSEPEFDFN